MEEYFAPHLVAQNINRIAIVLPRSVHARISSKNFADKLRSNKCNAQPFDTVGMALTWFLEPLQTILR